MTPSTPPSGPRPSPEQLLLTFRIIGGSLGLGVTFFAGVSWFLHQQGQPPRVAIDAGLLFNVLMAVAAAALVTAILVWRSRVAPLIEEPTGDQDPLERAGEIQTAVIIVWALVEAPALLAEVLYFLTGDAVAGVLGVALIWVGLGLTWPQADWFGRWDR